MTFTQYFTQYFSRCFTQYFTHYFTISLTFDAKYLFYLSFRLVREEFCKSLDDLASTISEKSINSTVPNYTPNRYSCHICTEAIGKARSTVRKERNFLMCWDCKQFTCTLCSVNHYNGPFTTNNQYTNQVTNSVT